MNPGILCDSFKTKSATSGARTRKKQPSRSVQALHAQIRYTRLRGWTKFNNKETEWYYSAVVGGRSQVSTSVSCCDLSKNMHVNTSVVHPWICQRMVPRRHRSPPHTYADPSQSPSSQTLFTTALYRPVTYVSSLTPSDLSPKRDCGPKRVNYHPSTFLVAHNSTPVDEGRKS